MSGVNSLVVDAGQTGTKVRLLLAEGDVLERTYPGVRTSEPLTPQLVNVAATLHEEIGKAFDVVAVGLSGLTDGPGTASEAPTRMDRFGARRVLVAHDSTTSFLGALGDSQGAVVAAGTGVVTLAVGRAEVARVDGWGHVMGDAGSGYWIGREALDAAMRAHDGRGRPTVLLDRLRSRWPDVENAYIDLQSDPDRVRVVASFAQAVAELAASDSIARQISENAARELALSVTSGLARVIEPGTDPADISVAMVGGVFRSVPIATYFAALLADRCPGVSIVEPRGTGLDGAQLLAELPIDHALRGHIAEAAVPTDTDALA